MRFVLGTISILLLTTGCGEVHFRGPEEAVKPRPITIVPTPPKPRLTEDFSYRRVSGTAITLFVFYPTENTNEPWSMAPRMLQDFMDQSRVHLKGFRRHYLGISLDASVGGERPVRWFDISSDRPRAESLDPSVAATPVDATAQLSLLAATMRVDKFTFFETFSSSLFKLASHTLLPPPTWVHIIYYRDYPIQPTVATRSMVDEGYKTLESALEGIPKQRTSIGSFRSIGQDVGVVEELTHSPIRKLPHQDLRLWRRGDTRSITELVRAIESADAQVILTQAPNPANLRVWSRGRELNKSDIDVTGHRIELFDTTLSSDDPIKVEYETP